MFAPCSTRTNSTGRNRAAKVARRTWGITNLELPTSDVDSASLVSIQVNENWLGVLLSAVSILEDPETWTDATDTERAEQQAFTLYQLIRNAGEPVTAEYPKHVTFWHDEATVLSGGSLLRSTLADPPYSAGNSFYNTISYQNPPADGDSFEQSFLAAAGDYNFRALGANNSVHGKIDWYIDDVPFLTGQDWYNGTMQANIVKSTTVTIATSGAHTLKGVVNDKNALSGAYAMALTKYWLEWIP